MNENHAAAPGVRTVEVSADQEGQRIDNFLMSRLKGVPKSHIYRLVRKGEVRVNKKRVKPDSRLETGDVVRIPPVRTSSSRPNSAPGAGLRELLNDSVLYKDDDVLVVNKPSGLAVHGGSGVSLGLIEALRAMEPGQAFLELVHRLDRDTSGCLVLARRRSALRWLHDEMRANRVDKYYQALVKGRWPKGRTRIDAPLKKNELQSGERIVRVDRAGKASVTHFSVLQHFADASLMEVCLETGRTHQIRVHTSFAGHPLAGDSKYGDQEFNQKMKEAGLKRLFLHACALQFRSPSTGKTLRIEAPLPEDLVRLLESIE